MLAGAIAGMVVVGFLLFMAALPFVAGIGLIQHRSWARPVALILALCQFIAFPVGTMLSIYGLWVLLNDETRAVLRPA